MSVWVSCLGRQYPKDNQLSDTKHSIEYDLKPRPTELLTHHRPSTRPLMIASITVLCADGRVANTLPRRMYALSIFSSPLPPPRRTRPDRQTEDSTGNAVDTCLVSHNGHVPGGSEITKGFAMASGHHRHWQCCNCPNREKHASLVED